MIQGLVRALGFLLHGSINSEFGFWASLWGLRFQVSGFGLEIRKSGTGLGCWSRVKGLGFRLEGIASLWLSQEHLHAFAKKL